MLNYILLLVCILGLCMGSFFNVVILRSLSGESIVFPGSKCPKCGEKLKPWHNIPVISYILLRGKCAFCKEKISIQYPIIELVTMILFAKCFTRFGCDFNTIFAMIICSALIIMTMTDLKERLVDCHIALGLAIVGLLYNTFINGTGWDALLGLIAGVLILEIIARLGYLFSKGRAMGEADTYVAGALGACFGLSGLFHVLIYSLIASMIVIVPIFLYNQIKQNNKAVCILSIIFTLSILIFKTLWQNYWTLGLLALTGFLLSGFILKSIKTKENQLTYLPFVPAFALGSLYFLFF